eukprot:8713773-Prorocentrum_lima.AAC.1
MGSGRRVSRESRGLGAGCMAWEEGSCGGAVRWFDAEKNTEVAGGGSVWWRSIMSVAGILHFQDELLRIFESTVHKHLPARGRRNTVVAQHAPRSAD